MTKVNLSQTTTKVLSNFDCINPSLMVRSGTMLNTQSVGQNIIVEYKSVEEWPQDFAIYELKQFLVGLTLFDSPTLEFDNDDYVVIRNTDKTRSSRYFFSDKEILESCSPEKRISFPEDLVVMEFNLSSEDLNALERASRAYNLNDLVFTAVDKDSVDVSLVDLENETNNTFNLHLPAVCDIAKSKKIKMKMENIKLYTGSYKVQLTDTVITKWKHTNIDLAYYIGVEPEDY